MGVKEVKSGLGGGRFGKSVTGMGNGEWRARGDWFAFGGVTTIGGNASAQTHFHFRIFSLDEYEKKMQIQHGKDTAKQ